METMTVPRLTYREIADDITARIHTGEYPPGAPLPSYKKLADLYSVSVSTAQRAIQLLHDRGLIVGEKGRGLFVKEKT